MRSSLDDYDDISDAAMLAIIARISSYFKGIAEERRFEPVAQALGTTVHLSKVSRRKLLARGGV